MTRTRKPGSAPAGRIPVWARTSLGREIRVLHSELRRQMPDIVAVSEPAILRSAFVQGIKRLPVAWTG